MIGDYLRTVEIRFSMLAAVLGLALGGAAPAPSSPDNETTALEPANEALLGVTANSIGTTTNTGTPAQSVVPEYQPGSPLPPPNVLQPLGPVPAPEQQPAAGPRPPSTASEVPPGHGLAGSFAAMTGAVDASASIPMNPYVAILGTPGRDPAR